MRLSFLVIIVFRWEVYDSEYFGYVGIGVFRLIGGVKFFRILGDLGVINCLMNMIVEG